MSNTENVKKELQTIEEQIAKLEAQRAEIEGRPNSTDADFVEYEKVDRELEALKTKQNRILTFVATDKRGARRS